MMPLNTDDLRKLQAGERAAVEIWPPAHEVLSMAQQLAAKGAEIAAIRAERDAVMLELRATQEALDSAHKMIVARDNEIGGLKDEIAEWQAGYLPSLSPDDTVVDLEWGAPFDVDGVTCRSVRYGSAFLVASMVSPRFCFEGPTENQAIYKASRAVAFWRAHDSRRAIERESGGPRRRRVVHGYSSRG
jgi:hypothetical protein